MRQAIPRKAVKPLIEHCNQWGMKMGRSGAEVFQEYLVWMKRYGDFFSMPLGRLSMFVSGE